MSTPNKTKQWTLTKSQRRLTQPRLLWGTLSEALVCVGSTEAERSEEEELLAFVPACSAQLCLSRDAANPSKGLRMARLFFFLLWAFSASVVGAKKKNCLTK